MTAVRGFLSHLSYMWEKNRTRLIVLLAVITFLVILNGSRGLMTAAVGFLASAPFLAVQLLFAITFMIIQFGALFWFLSRPRKYTVTPDDAQIGLSFENYRGQPDLLEHAKSTVKILQGLSNFEKLGGDMPKGMLLSGRPGTGKTFLAGCIAAEANLPFIYIDASSLRGMFIGMDTLMVMKLFRDARGLGRKYARDGQRGACIMFMDELDSIGGARSGQAGMPVGGMGMGMFGGGGAGLNTLLNQMDSLGDHVEDRWRVKVLRWFGIVRGPVPQKPLIFVIGATNRPEILDPALTRPGRLDRMLHVYAPDGEGRRDIISHYLNMKAHDPAMDIDFMVADSIGWTPVMIKTIINEALVIAHDDGRDYLNYKDWLGGRRLPRAGPEAADSRRVRGGSACHRVPRGRPRRRRPLSQARRPDHQGLDHPRRRRPGRRPVERQGRAAAQARAPARDRHHGGARVTRGRGDLPRHEDDWCVERPDGRLVRSARVLRLLRHGQRPARHAIEREPLPTRCRSPAWPNPCSRPS